MKKSTEQFFKDIEDLVNGWYRDPIEDDLPVILPLPPYRPTDPNAPIAKCGQCGILLYKVMGYACPHGNCPCGLGPIMCQNNDPSI